MNTNLLMFIIMSVISLMLYYSFSYNAFMGFWVVLGITRTIKEIFTSNDALKAIPTNYLIYTGVGFWLCDWIVGLVMGI